MNVVGFSFGYHDSTVALVQDGVVKRVISEERMSLQKHDYSFPKLAYEKCLEAEGLSSKDIDHIVFHEDPHNKFSRVLTSSLYHFPFSRLEFVNTIKSWLGKKIWAIGKIAEYSAIHPQKISYLNHHYSHALQAFMGSGFSSSAILVVDAVGDWTSTAYYRGSWEDGIPKIEKLKEIAFPTSLGLVYSAATAYLGFVPNDSECSTMALASFGQNRFQDKYRKVVPSHKDLVYDVDQSYFHFMDFYKGAVTKKFEDLFGPKMDSKEKYQFNCFSGEQAVSENQQRLADIAATFQVGLEENLVRLCRDIKTISGEENLCYAGGVSLNCVANKKILESGIFKNLFIPPEPGDGGTSVGIALYQSLVKQDKKMKPEELKYHPYQGVSYDERATVDMISKLEHKSFEKYLKENVKVSKEWKIKTFDKFEKLANYTSDQLINKKIVGWYQGRFELGPRALGNRSLLFRADDIELAKKVSQTVKERASFRPYALSMTFEDASRVLKTDQDLSNYKYMQISCDVRDEVVEQVRAGLHVDQSTRPQVCGKDDNERFHTLLTAYGTKSGIAAVVNTSFNSKSYPIVSNPYEALAMFVRTNMDVLVLNNTVIEKV